MDRPNQDPAGYEPTDRRPIASRGLSWVKALTRWMAERGVSPNAISISSILFASAGATALLATRAVDGTPERMLWLATAACVQLRLLANLFDGMVAMESGKASALGELFNEVPDRLADVAILVALGFVAGSSPHLGYAAAVLAVFVSYVRAVGVTAGASQAFAGLMAKPKRMFLVTVLCLFQAVVPASWHGWNNALGLGGPGIVLVLIGLGCVVTAITRLRVIAWELERAR